MAECKQRWAVVDMGSNTVRLCVYEVSGPGKYNRIATSKFAVGLASYVDEANVLVPGGLKAASRALKKLTEMAVLMDCQRVMVFATGAARNCSNSDEVIDALQKKCGYPIEVISGRDEARLSLRGALQTVDCQSGLFFDIGGGSTELMTLKRGTYKEGESIPMGSLSSWSKYVKNILPEEGELSAFESAMSILIDSCGVDLARHERVCGIGGTMRLALKVSKALRNDDSDNREVDMDDFDRIFSLLESDPIRLSSMLLQLNPARVHTFLPGCIIAQEILRKSGCGKIIVAKSGLREGYLLSKLDELTS